MGTPEAARIFTEALVSGLGAEDDDGDDEIKQNSPSSSSLSVSFDALALRGLAVVSSAPGRIVCRLPLTREKSNRYGTLHGGCAATLVDVCGTAAIVSVSESSGVSLHIGVDYLSPAPVGGGGAAGKNFVVVDSRVVRVGRTIAVANVEIYYSVGKGGEGEEAEEEERGGKRRVLVAQGTHIKHVGSPDKSRVRRSSQRARL